MGFWSNLFKSKKIIKVEIASRKAGFSEEDQLSHLVIGHMEGGFDGMVTASVYNDYHSAETTFKVYYDNKTYKFITAKDGSTTYNYYIRLVK